MVGKGGGRKMRGESAPVWEERRSWHVFQYWGSACCFQAEPQQVARSQREPRWCQSLGTSPSKDISVPGWHRSSKATTHKGTTQAEIILITHDKR